MNVFIKENIILENGEQKIELSFAEFREISHAAEEERCRREIKNRLKDMVQIDNCDPALLEDVNLIEDILDAYLENLKLAREDIAKRQAAELHDAIDQYNSEIQKYTRK